MTPVPSPRFALLAPAVILLAFALACTQIPLLNMLGYEFAASTALLISLLAGTGAARLVAWNATGEPRAYAWRLALRSTVTSWVLLLIPLAVLSVNALNVRTCSWSDGLLWFLALPVVSAWFSSCLGAFCALHYRHPRTIFIGLLALSLGYALALGYWTPAVFSYNFFYGYFPGLTYDEALSPDRPLILFRIVSILAGGVLLWMAALLARTTDAAQTTPAKGRALIEALVVPRRLPFTIGLVAASALLYAWRGPLGFEAPPGFVRSELGGMYESEHWTLYYSPTQMSGERLRKVAAEHEFRLTQVAEEFHFAPHERYSSYLYPSGELKRRLIGTGGTDIAKPWSGEIHLDAPSLEGSLKHEVVHLVAARFGIPVLRASLAVGLVEGLAMAVEWDFGNRTLHQWAAGMRSAGIAPDIRHVMSLTGFAVQAPSVSYVLAGSFCRFLIDRYGMRRMTLLYRTGDYRGVYNGDLDDLAAQWENFLGTVPVRPSDRDAVDALFRSAPIMRKECARSIAARNREAGRLLARGEYREAADAFGRAYERTRGDDALRGLLIGALRAGRIGTLLNLRDTVVLADQHPARFLSSFVELGLASWTAGDTASARNLFHRVEEADAVEEWTEAAIISRLAMNDSLNHQALLRYLSSGGTDSLRVVRLDSMRGGRVHDPLPLYCKGRTLARMGRTEDALAALQIADMKQMDRRLEALRWRTIAEMLLRQGRIEDARGAFWTSLNYRADEVWRLRIGERLDRCEWESRREEAP